MINLIHILSLAFTFLVVSQDAWSYAETRKHLKSLDQEQFSKNFKEHCTTNAFLNDPSEGNYFNFMTTEYLGEAERRLSKVEEAGVFALLVNCTVKLNFLSANFLYDIYSKDQEKFEQMAKNILSEEDLKKLLWHMKYIQMNVEQGN